MFWLFWNLRPDNFQHYYTMSDNKLVKTIMDTDTLTGLTTGIGCVLEKRWWKRTSPLTPPLSLLAVIRWNNTSKTRKFFRPVRKISILLHVQMAGIGMILSLVATTLLAICVVTVRPHWNKKSGMTKPLRHITPLTLNTHMTAPSFLTGSYPTRKWKKRWRRTLGTPIAWTNSVAKHTWATQLQTPKNSILCLLLTLRAETRRLSLCGQQCAHSQLWSSSFSLNFSWCYIMDSKLT